MPSLVVIGPQIKEKQRGAQCPPAYMVPKDPSLNRVKSKFYQYFVFTKKCSNDLSHFASVLSLRTAYLWEMLVTIEIFYTITSKIKNIMKYHDKLMRKLNKKYTQDNEYLYKKFRNRVASELRTSRINYYNKYFTEHKNNMKILWTGIFSIINV